MLPFAGLLTGTGLVTSAWNALRAISPQTPSQPPGATSSDSAMPPSGGASTAEVVGHSTRADNEVFGTSKVQGQWEVLGKIATRYDVTKITPREFSRLLEELRQAGALSETDRQLLAQILVDLHQEGIDLDETVDLVRFYTKKGEKLQDSLRTKSIPPQARLQLEAALTDLQKRLDWLRRFALLHERPELASLNLLT
jgi:hypothetical protein